MPARRRRWSIVPPEAPTHIEGVPVEREGDRALIGGAWWWTYRPVDVADGRIWEWNEATGLIVRTRGAGA